MVGTYCTYSYKRKSMTENKYKNTHTDIFNSKYKYLVIYIKIIKKKLTWIICKESNKKPLKIGNEIRDVIRKLQVFSL